MSLHYIKNGIKKKIIPKLPSLFPSSRTTYDNTDTDLSSTNVQDAIDEITVKYALVSFSIPDSGSSYNFSSLVPSGFSTTNSYVVSKMLFADAWYYDPVSLSVYTAGTAFLVSYPENYRGRQCKILLAKPSTIIQ